MADRPKSAENNKNIQDEAVGHYIDLADAMKIQTESHYTELPDTGTFLSQSLVHCEKYWVDLFSLFFTLFGLHYFRNRTNSVLLNKIRCIPSFRCKREVRCPHSVSQFLENIF